MTDFIYKQPSIIPRTLEDAKLVKKMGERQRAQAEGDWLPEGWVFVEENHPGVPVDGLGAWNPEREVLVYVVPPPWSCPWCGTEDRLSSPCVGADFLEESGRKQMHDRWASERVRATTLGVSGEGAPIVVFEMVWKRWSRRVHRYDGG